MFKLKSPIFLNTGDCGCSPVPQSSTPVCPPTGAAAICDTRYFTLGASQKLKMLGVAAGGNCQTFLEADEAGGIGFIFMGPDGQVFVSDQPQLSLPPINPDAGGVFPIPGGFSSLLIANGPNPQTWFSFHAPTAGTHSLISENGLWVLKDAASLSGQTAVCNNPSAVTKVALFGCVDSGTVDSLGAPIFVLRKLTPAHHKVVVGDIDPGTGVAGFKILPATDELFHEFMKAGAMKAGTYKQYDLAGPTDDTGGIMVRPDTVTDAVLAMYSPTLFKFYRVPARTKESKTTDADVLVADNGSYQSMGGHCQFTALQFNFPDFFFACSIRIRSSGTDYTGIFFGLFIDGVLVNEWDLKNDTSVALSYLHKGLAVGAHTVEVKFKQGVTADAMTVKFSTANIFSVL